MLILVVLLQTVMISATPTAFLVEMIATEEKSWKEDIEFIRFSPNSNYFGVEDIKPLLGSDGEEIYLQQNEVTAKGSTFGEIRIPYANEKVKALYDDAVKQEKRGVLLLDVSCPRVHTIDNNIRQKAKQFKHCTSTRINLSSLLLSMGQESTLYCHRDYRNWVKYLILLRAQRRLMIGTSL